MAEAKAKLKGWQGTDLEDYDYQRQSIGALGSANNQGPQEDEEPILFVSTKSGNVERVYKKEKRLGFVKEP